MFFISSLLIVTQTFEKKKITPNRISIKGKNKNKNVRKLNYK